MAARMRAKGSSVGPTVEANGERAAAAWSKPVSKKKLKGKSKTRRPIDSGEQVVLDESALAPEHADALRELLSHAKLSREDIRIQAVFGADGGPLQSTWAFHVEHDEVVLEARKTTRPSAHGQQLGIVGFVVAGHKLPQPKLDDAERERIASALADALLAEVMRGGR